MPPPPALLDAPPEGATRIAVAGDVGEPSHALDATVTAMMATAGERPFDGLVLLGDNVYPFGHPDLVEPAVHEPFAPVLGQGTPLYAVLGNHDVHLGNGDEVAETLGMPARWYEQRIGPAQMIAVDSTQPDHPEQLTWLDAVLRAPAAGPRIVALHHPPYSAGWHGSSRDSRRSFVPLFRRHGVDLVLGGHEHDYQRSRPIKGTTYMVSGAATHLRPTGRARFTASSAALHHFLDLWATGDSLHVRAVGHDGAAFDAATIPAQSPAGLTAAA